MFHSSSHNLHETDSNPLHFYAEAQCLHVSVAANAELIQEEVPLEVSQQK